MVPSTRLRLATAILAGFAALPVEGARPWIEIDASAPFVDRTGVERTPSCSGGPVLMETADGPVPVAADTRFSFFFREGRSDKLAILWDGGGACWDPNTCIGSALAGSALYSQSVDETPATLDALGGIGDSTNPANPVGDYTQVFIPYCSGDLHAGAKETTYFYTAPDGSTIPWTIHHRGHDNVVAVLEWLRHYYRNEVGRAPSRVFLSGASAGGYGVLYNYPAVAALLPRYTRTRVLVDAANGIINQDFFDKALTPGGVWGVWENIPPALTEAFSSGPDEFAIELFKGLGWAYPRTRFGQYTTAFDAVQIFFFNVARNIDDPEAWADPVQLLGAGLEWTVRARASMLLSALQTFNYHFYMARGDDHTVVGGDKFYTENTADSVFFTDWLDDMINRRWPWGGDWRNVSCAPNCLP